MVFLFKISGKNLYEEYILVYAKTVEEATAKIQDKYFYITDLTITLQTI